jgi:anti-anti-sigma factor
VKENAILSWKAGAGRPVISTRNLTVTAERCGPLCMLSVSGDLDMSSAGQFPGLVAAVINGHAGRVVVDMSGVRFIDCAGARALASVARGVPGGSSVVVRSLRPPVRRLLDQLGLDLDLFGPYLELMSLDLEPRSGPGALASRTAVLMHQSRQARSAAQHAITDSRLLTAVSLTMRRQAKDLRHQAQQTRRSRQARTAQPDSVCP